MARQGNRNFLKNARINKKDEFFTQLSDIERELSHYESHFEGKIIYCNCDDVLISEFYNYFVTNFYRLKIKKIICSCYKGNNDLFETNKGYWYEYDGSNNPYPTIKDVNYFQGNGDFRSIESIELLTKSDLIITNPPFSLFREFVNQIIKYNKSFLIIGNINCITYKDVFELIKTNKAWLGINLGRGISGFIVPEYYDLYGTETKKDNKGRKIVSPNNCLWLTNLDNFKRHSNIPLVKKYKGNEDYYPTYDNFNAININKTKDIPCDYDGYMGVPITFLHKFNPEQFEIIKFRKGNDDKDLSINGKTPYFRILIKKKDKQCSNFQP